jgi:hypothetical protein
MENKERLIDLSYKYQEIHFNLNDILKKHNLNLLEYKNLPNEDLILWEELKKKANAIHEEMTRLINEE